MPVITVKPFSIKNYLMEQTIYWQRPFISDDIASNQTQDEEMFQNYTLRPIIKMRHNLFMRVLIQYFGQHKNEFYNLSSVQREDYIIHILGKDLALRNLLKGIVIGQFTDQEFETYCKMSIAINKRIIGVIKKRVLTNMSQLDNKIL